MRILIPYLEIVKKSFMIQIEYKTDFYLRCLYEIAIVAVNLAVYNIIYYQNGNVAGWELPQLRILVLIAALLDGFITFFFVEGLNKFPRMIANGELDFLLVKPVNKRIYISFNQVCASQIVSITIFLIYTFSQLLIQKYTWMQILISASFFLVSLFILYCFFFSIMTLSFWLVRIDVGVSFFFQLFTLGNKPLEIYPYAIQKVLIYILPVGIAINYPARAFGQFLSVRHFLELTMVAVLFFVLSEFLFIKGLKHYHSVG